MSHPATWRTTPDDDPTDILLCGMAPVREAVNQPALTPVLTLYGKPSLIYACIATHGAMTRK